MDQIELVPEGLSSLQYACKICEDLGIPERGNIQMIGEAIEAASKSRLLRGRPLRDAFIWMRRRVNVAQDQGQEIDNLWFMHGQYNKVEKPLAPPQRISYEHFGKGYGTQDMLWLYDRYQSKRKGLDRPLEAAEVESLMAELDKKRGEAPAWRAR